MSLFICVCLVSYVHVPYHIYKSIESEGVLLRVSCHMYVSFHMCGLFSHIYFSFHTCGSLSIYIGLLSQKVFVEGLFSYVCLFSYVWVFFIYTCLFSYVWVSFHIYTSVELECICSGSLVISIRLGSYIYVSFFIHTCLV